MATIYDTTHENYEGTSFYEIKALRHGTASPISLFLSVFIFIFLFCHVFVSRMVEPSQLGIRQLGVCANHEEVRLSAGKTPELTSFTQPCSSIPWVLGFRSWDDTRHATRGYFPFSVFGFLFERRMVINIGTLAVWGQR